MIQQTRDEHGQPVVDVRTASVAGRLHLHGATLVDWTPRGHAPVLFLSSRARFDGQTPIRGGVPICLPWFGATPADPKLPADAPGHGWARSTRWQLEHSGVSREEVLLGLRLQRDGLDVRYGVMLGHTLKLVLEVENVGPDARRVEAALHTYFAVSDARGVEVTGLEDAAYLDKIDGGTRKPATGMPIRFAGETDRVYGATQNAVTLHDPGGEAVPARRIVVAKEGGASTVVWNPWAEKAARMDDFGDDEWTRMCCIESAAVGDDAWTLTAGETRTLAAEISVTRG